MTEIENKTVDTSASVVIAAINRKVSLIPISWLIHKADLITNDAMIKDEIPDITIFTFFYSCYSRM